MAVNEMKTASCITQLMLNIVQSSGSQYSQLSGKDIEYRLCLKGIHMNRMNFPPCYQPANMVEVFCQGNHFTHTQHTHTHVK